MISIVTFEDGDISWLAQGGGTFSENRICEDKTWSFLTGRILPILHYHFSNS